MSPCCASRPSAAFRPANLLYIVPSMCCMVWLSKYFFRLCASADHFVTLRLPLFVSSRDGEDLHAGLGEGAFVSARPGAREVEVELAFHGEARSFIVGKGQRRHYIIRFSTE